MSAPRPESLWRIFGWPLVLGVLSIVGLLAALLGNGPWDLVSWLCLGAMPVVMLRFLLRGRG